MSGNVGTGDTQKDARKDRQIDTATDKQNKYFVLKPTNNEHLTRVYRNTR